MRGYEDVHFFEWSPALHYALFCCNYLHWKCRVFYNSEGWAGPGWYVSVVRR